MRAEPETVSRPVAPPGGLRSGLMMLTVFLLAEVTMLVTAVLVVLPFAVSDPDLVEDGLSAGLLLAVLAVPTVVAALVAVGGTALLGGGARSGRVRRELAAWWDWRDLRIGLGIGVAGLLLTLPAAAVWAAWVGDDQATSAVSEAFAGRELGPAAAVAVFLAVWLVLPLCEEVIFRGVLWRALEHWRWNRWLVFAGTTAVFSIAHLELLRTPLLLVISIPIGLARMFTGNLLAGVVAHQVNNFLPALALLLMTTGSLPA